jgi:AraC family transcriptional regulator, transcriptional activator of pobA
MFEPAAPGTEFRMTSLARMAQGGKWRVEAMRSYSRPFLLWFTRGQGRITVNGVTRGYGPHNAVFIPAGTMHGFDMVGTVHGQAIFFPRGVDLGLPATSLHLRLRDATVQAEITALVDAMERELNRDQPGMDRALYHHAGLVAVWLERQAAALSPADRATSRPKASVRLAEAYSTLLERDFRSGKGVADYAAELGVTPTHLSRVCNETCGRPAHGLLQDRVLFEARRLLRDTALPVKDVARTLGFTSPAYFTRAFQVRTGLTPSEFRTTPDRPSAR